MPIVCPTPAKSCLFDLRCGSDDCATTQFEPGRWEYIGMGTRQSFRLGMVGGGPGSGIGPAHRYGASMDNAFELVAGAFSRDPDKNAQMGESLGLDLERVYADFETMAATESKLTGGIRAVSIVTPNDTAKACRIIRAWSDRDSYRLAGLFWTFSLPWPQPNAGAVPGQALLPRIGSLGQLAA
jgi:hypothetical protein